MGFMGDLRRFPLRATDLGCRLDLALALGYRLRSASLTSTIFPGFRLGARKTRTNKAFWTFLGLTFHIAFTPAATAARYVAGVQASGGNGEPFRRQLQVRGRLTGGGSFCRAAHVASAASGFRPVTGVQGPWFGVKASGWTTWIDY